jgi:hypothetical protein
VKPASIPLPRDLRLDFFRGLALLFIFIDHVPGNRLADFTLRNFGFSDSSELFVFIAAITAGLVYTSRGAGGFADANRRMFRRLTYLYAAHVVLLAAVALFAGGLSRTLRDPQFVNGLNVRPLLEQPAQVMPQVLALTFQPTFMNILPLYIVLLLPLPLILWIVRRRPIAALVLSFGLYLAARVGQGVLPTPFGVVWQFNPLAWQFLFVIGVVIGALSAKGALHIPRSPLMLGLSAGYLGWALWAGTDAWSYDGTSLAGPGLLRSMLFPVMDRVNLSLWRITHVLALAYLVTAMLRADSRVLGWRLSRALILCGQHSLALFSAGVVLSVAGWAAFIRFGAGTVAQVLVNVIGFAALMLLAWLLDLRSGRRTQADPSRQSMSINP